MTRPRSARAVAAVIVAVAALSALDPAARAQERDTVTGSIDVQSLTTLRTADQPLTYAFRVRSSAPLAALELAVAIHRRVGSRSEFAETVEGRFRTRAPVELLRVPLDTVAPDANGLLVASLTPTTTREGVHPARVELRHRESGDVLDAFVTHLVNLPAAVDADPLAVALVLPVHAPPAVQADGTSDIDDGRAESLAELAAALEAQPALPLTLVPTAETLDALAASTRAAERETVASLGRAVTGREVLAGTYAPTDLRAVLDAGLAGEVAASFERAVQVVQRTLAVAPATANRVVDDPLDRPALDVLRDQGVQRLVVAERLLEPVPLRVTLTARFDVVAAGDERVPAIVADGALAAHFTRDASPVLRAAHLLADLAVLWFDSPTTAPTRRGVVVAAPRSWTPDARLLAPLLASLRTTTVLEPHTVDSLFGAIGEQRVRSNVLVRRFLAADRTVGPNGPATRAARQRIESFASGVETTNPALDRLERTLLTSLSSDLRTRQRGVYVRGVADQIARQLRRVQMPSRRSITLTAREGEIPVTVTNELPYPIKVVVELSSDSLEFPDRARRQIELARANTTERFAVHATSSGSFPVSVRMTSPDGDLVLAETRFTVRSTAVSGVGVALSVGAAGFLLFWWAGHLRSTRRAARRDLAATPPPG